jgi:hypothetical protein
MYVMLCVKNDICVVCCTAENGGNGWRSATNQVLTTKEGLVALASEADKSKVTRRGGKLVLREDETVKNARGEEIVVKTVVEVTIEQLGRFLFKVRVLLLLTSMCSHVMAAVAQPMSWVADGVTTSVSHTQPRSWSATVVTTLHC